MKCEAYCFDLAYESWRPRPKEGIVADVYDCAQWKRTFGPDPPRHEPTIGSIKLLFCYDGIAAHNYPGAASLVPAEFVVMSLPPWSRYKVDNILISMLLPDGLSSAAQKKFFDKVIEVDFLPLFSRGVKHSSGHNVRVEIFGQVCDCFTIYHYLCIISLPLHMTDTGPQRA